MVINSPSVRVVFLGPSIFSEKILFLQCDFTLGIKLNKFKLSELRSLNIEMQKLYKALAKKGKKKLGKLQ